MTPKNDVVLRHALRQQRLVAGFRIVVQTRLGRLTGAFTVAAVIQTQYVEAHRAQRFAMAYLPRREGRLAIAVQMQNPVAGIVAGRCAKCQPGEGKAIAA